MSGLVSDDAIERAYTKVASYVGITVEELRSVLKPWNAREQSEEEKHMRANIANEIYKMGYSLAEVGYMMGDLSKERVRQILVYGGYQTRPMPGSARWRMERARV